MAAGALQSTSLELLYALRPMIFTQRREARGVERQLRERTGLWRRNLGENLKDVGDVDLRVQWAGGFSKGQNRQLFRVSGLQRRRHTTNSKSSKSCRLVCSTGLGPRLVLVCASVSCFRVPVWPLLACLGPALRLLWRLIKCPNCQNMPPGRGPLFFFSWDDHIQAIPRSPGSLVHPLGAPNLPGRTMRPWARYPWAQWALGGI